VQQLHCGVVADFLALSIERLGSLLVLLEQQGMIAPCPPRGLRLTNLDALKRLVEHKLPKVVRGVCERDVSSFNADTGR